MKYFIAFSIFFIVSCNHTIKKDHPELAEAKSIHHHVAALQEQDPLKRLDRDSCGQEMVKNTYQHPIAYSAFFFYNVPLAILKDMSILVASPLAEATNVCLDRPRSQLNDHLNEGYENNYYISYPDMYYSLWGYDGNGNYVNMDNYDYNRLDYYANKE